MPRLIVLDLVVVMVTISIVRCGNTNSTVQDPFLAVPLIVHILGCRGSCVFYVKKCNPCKLSAWWQLLVLRARVSLGLIHQHEHTVWT